MNIARQRIDLDLNKSIASVVINAKQGDAARRMEFCLREDGNPYHIDDDTAAYLYAKTDGSVLGFVCDIEDDIIIINIDDAITSIPGTIECEITLKGVEDDAVWLTSPRFAIRVEESLASVAEQQSES